MTGFYLLGQSLGRRSWAEGGEVKISVLDETGTFFKSPDCVSVMVL